MNSSHNYIGAIVILIAFLHQCSGQFPRDIPIMRHLARAIRKERDNQITTEEEKRTFHPNVPHLCDLEPSLLEEVCEEVIRSTIIGVDRIISPRVPTQCLKCKIGGTKATKRVVECAARRITWDGQHLAPDVAPLPERLLETFFVGASTSAKNKILIFVSGIFGSEPKAVVLSKLSDFVLPNHPDVRFIDNDIKQRFDGDESDISFEEAELNTILRVNTRSNNDAIRRRSMPRMSVIYELE